jgi:alpha-N-acetylglucosamine transferase
MLVSILLYPSLYLYHLYNLPQVWSAAANDIITSYHKSLHQEHDKDNDERMMMMMMKKKKMMMMLYATILYLIAP